MGFVLRYFLQMILMAFFFLGLFGSALSFADAPGPQGASARHLKILLVLPHPDDESMIRATLSRLIERGHEVSEICLTRGEGGKDARNGGSRQQHSEEPAPQIALQLAKTRTSEMAAAAAAFGFKNLFQMTFPDIPVRDPVTGKPTRDPHFFLKPDGPWPLNEIQKKISAIAVAVAPDMVITFYPGQTDIHAHHQATAEIAKGLYVQHTLGAAAKNIYGFRENVSTEAGDLQARLKLAQQWLLFSPKKISPITGLSYGQMGSKAELLHKSQMNATTGAFVKNWQQEPDEAFASIDESKDLSALKEALGDLFQNDLSLENRDNEIGSR